MSARGEFAVADLWLNSDSADVVGGRSRWGGGYQNFPPKGRDRQVRSTFFYAKSQNLFFWSMPPSPPGRYGGVGASLGKEQTEDRYHCHSGIFFSRRSVSGGSELLRSDFASQIKCPIEIIARNNVLFFRVAMYAGGMAIFGGFCPGTGGPGSHAKSRN
jgi:hypothetical protein